MDTSESILNDDLLSTVVMIDIDKVLTLNDIVRILSDNEKVVIRPLRNERIMSEKQTDS